jgi:hypothetical protein
MEKEAIKFGIETTFHMIRHFEEITSTDSSKLLNEGYTQVQIDNELKMYSSKFNKYFALTINDLIQKATTDVYEITVGANGNYQLYFPNTTQDSFYSVGSLAVVHIDHLTQSQKQKIHLRENRGYPLKHVNVAVLPTTNVWTMILKPYAKGCAYFITAFPGKPALPIPHHEMSLTQKNACVAFWDEHIFLVDEYL